jgi:hypothetical protein
MDHRNMREIKVSWQLGLFIAAIFALPISLAPVFTAVTGERRVSRSVLNVSEGIAAGLLVVMGIAVGSRVHQARKEQLPDGQPMSRWVLRQVAIGSLLCVAGVGILAALAWVGAPAKLAAIGCTVAAGPGVILIGRALAPAR